MTITEDYEQIAQTLIASASPTTVYTVPASTQIIIKHMTIVNPSGAACWVKMWTDGASDVNLIMPQVSIDAGGWAEFDGTITLDVGETLKVQAETNNVTTITVHGLKLVTS